MAFKRRLKAIIVRIIVKIYQGKAPHRLSFFPFPFVFFVLSILNRKRKKYADDPLIVNYIENGNCLQFEEILFPADVFFLKSGFQEDPYALYEVVESRQYKSVLWVANEHNRRSNLLFKTDYAGCLNFYINEKGLLSKKMVKIIGEFFSEKQKIHFFLQDEKKTITNQFTTSLEKLGFLLQERLAIALRCDFYCGGLDPVGIEIMHREMPALYNCSAPDDSFFLQYSGKVFEKNLENLSEKELKALLYPILENISL